MHFVIFYLKKSLIMKDFLNLNNWLNLEIIPGPTLFSDAVLKYLRLDFLETIEVHFYLWIMNTAQASDLARAFALPHTMAEDITWCNREGLLA